MSEFEIVFDKMAELVKQDAEDDGVVRPMPSSEELDELDELRRFAADLQDPDPVFFTTT